MLVTSYRRRSVKFSFFNEYVYYIEIKRYNDLKQFNLWLQRRFPDKSIDIMRTYKRVKSRKDDKIST